MNNYGSLMLLNSSGLPRCLSGKASVCQCRRLRDVGLIPGLGRSPGVGNGNSLHYSCLENHMHRGVWWAEVRGVTRVGYN